MAEPKLEIFAAADKPTIETRRAVNAPRALVWDCFTKPEHVRRWMGPRGLDIVVCDLDMRAGGRWRMVHRGPDGTEFAFSGEIREVVRPERIVRTFVFEAFPDAVAVETLELIESGAQTIIKTLTVHQTLEGRDGHLKHGMEAGMKDGYSRLDELVASITRGGASASL